MLRACENVLASGRNVVIVAHARVRKQELPEEMGAFDHWELKLSRQCAPLLAEWPERVVMDWSKVLGARGRAHFKPRTYTSNGSEHTTNSVDRYYDFDPQAMQQDWVRDAEQAVMNGTAQQMPSQPQYVQQQMGWKNGGF